MAIEPHSATVTIYGGDYLDRIRHLEKKAEAAREADGVRTLDEVPEYVKLAEEHDALVKEAEEQATHVKVTALRRSAWKLLVGKHPPRDGNENDKALGVNEDTFKDDLVAASVDLSEDDLDTISDADYDRLYYEAFGLNRGMGSTPKANLLSRMSQESDATSS